MSITTKGSQTKGLTLGFELSAFQKFSHPNKVISDAREWSRHVGLIANDTDALTTYVEAHNLHQDFDLGNRDKWLALEEIRRDTNTVRHVFVGTTTDDRMAAEQTGWEFISLHEAAEKAGWTFEEQTPPDTGILDRFRTRLRTNTLWPGENQ